jgi:hypothetical protein
MRTDPEFFTKVNEGNEEQMANAISESKTLRIVSGEWRMVKNCTQGRKSEDGDKAQQSEIQAPDSIQKENRNGR